MAPSKGKQTSFLGRVDRWQAEEHSDEGSYDSSDFEGIMHMASQQAAQRARDDEAREHEIEEGGRAAEQPTEEEESFEHDARFAELEEERASAELEYLVTLSTSLSFAIEHCVVIYATESRIKLLDTANTKAYDIEWPDRRETVNLSNSSKSSYRAVVREFSAGDQLFYDCGKYKLQAIDETSKVHEKFIKAVIEYAETQGQNVK